MAEGTPVVAPMPALGWPANLFNPVVTVTWELPEAGRATLAVYDAAGRRVATLLDADRGAGPGLVSWNAAVRASMVYFVRLRAGTTTRVAEVVLLR